MKNFRILKYLWAVLLVLICDEDIIAPASNGKFVKALTDRTYVQGAKGGAKNHLFSDHTLNDQLGLAHTFSHKLPENKINNYTLSPYLIDIALSILGKTSSVCRFNELRASQNIAPIANWPLSKDQKLFVWVNVIHDNQIAVKKSFKQNIRSLFATNPNHNVSFGSLNFKSDANIKKFVQSVNSQVARLAGEPSLKAIDENMLRDKDTKLIIASTLYFKAKWQKPYTKLTLHGFGNRAIPIEYLYYGDNLGTMKVKEAAITARKNVKINLYSFPYQGDQFSMVYVVPEVWSADESSMLDTHLTDIVKAMKNLREVKYDKVYVPRIKQTLSFDLDKDKEFDCFKQEGKLQELTSYKRIFLKRIRHTVKFETSIQGTTGISQVEAVFGQRSVTKDLIIDKIFEYFVWDEINGNILFYGMFSQ